MNYAKNIKKGCLIKSICSTLIIAIFFIIREVMQSDILHMTRPSIFCYSMRISIIILALIFFLISALPLKWKCMMFKSPKQSERFINVILSLQMFAALSDAFFSLRFEFVSLFARNPFEWTQLIYAAFYVCIFMSEFFAFSRIPAVVFGVSYVCLEVGDGYNSILGMSMSTYIGIMVVIAYLICVCKFDSFKGFFYFKDYSNNLSLVGNDADEESGSCYLISAVKSDNQISLLILFPDGINKYAVCNLASEEAIFVDEVDDLEALTDSELDLFFESVMHNFLSTYDTFLLL